MRDHKITDGPDAANGYKWDCDNSDNIIYQYYLLKRNGVKFVLFGEYEGRSSYCHNPKSGKSSTHILIWSQVGPAIYIIRYTFSHW